MVKKLDFVCSSAFFLLKDLISLRLSVFGNTVDLGKRKDLLEFVLGRLVNQKLSPGWSTSVHILKACPLFSFIHALLKLHSELKTWVVGQRQTPSPKYEKGIRSLAYLTRDIESPILVLPKDHPSSKRLKMVLSVGENVRLDCGIVPGTHPEQDILCSCDSLSGLNIIKSKEGVIIDGTVPNYKIEPF